MEGWLWAFAGIMAVVTVTLCVKIHLLQKAAEEIERAFADRLKTDTNTLIDISCNDKYMRHLANAINIELRKLRMQRHRFQQGDTELKNAVTNISHDLRTPLTAICGYLDLLDQEEKSEPVTRYLDIIRNRADMLILLTEELFRYSVTISSGNDTAERPVVINRVLEESLAAFYTALNEKGIVPHIQMPKTDIVKRVDPSALSRVFSNLLNNAIKYSDSDLDITLSETGEISFTNTAARLNEIQVGKLFDRFYTVEAARNSTGLGLAIAKTLVEQMNGSISAKYENNRLRICILFPNVNE
ncbi:MAG: HAMP domain-containing sensor histidine kinase [Oscillospiraceae bacterium]|nr:HAMP domain-containing sensor histidine kinase [Oscillospiraceae bacterium]